MPDRAIELLRKLGVIEGISLVLLMGVAMPLKYLAGMPQPVLVVGWVHGVLFLLFCGALLNVMRVCRWPLLRAARPFAASLVPLGFLLIDRWLLRQRALQRAG